MSKTTEDVSNLQVTILGIVWLAASIYISFLSIAQSEDNYSFNDFTDYVFQVIPYSLAITIIVIILVFFFSDKKNLAQNFDKAITIPSFAMALGWLGFIVGYIFEASWLKSLGSLLVWATLIFIYIVILSYIYSATKKIKHAIGKPPKLIAGFIKNKEGYKFQVYLINQSEKKYHKVSVVTGAYTVDDDGITKSEEAKGNKGELKAHSTLLIDESDLGELDFVIWYKIKLYYENGKKEEIEFSLPKYTNENSYVKLPIINKQGIHIRMANSISIKKVSTKVFKILGLISIGFISLALISIFIEHNNTKSSYYGDKNPLTGEWCDYGFHIKNQTCCDEDDYSCEVCTWNNYDCTDFSNQIFAQDVFDKCRNFFYDVRDVHNLDSDDDGIACETLPRE